MLPSKGGRYEVRDGKHVLVERTGYKPKKADQSDKKESK